MDTCRPCKRRFILVSIVVATVFVAAVMMFSLPPREEEEPIMEPLLYPCEPAPEIEVDGNLSDWASTLWAPLGVESQAEGRWGGRRDAEARVALRWDKESLYLAARVRDDRIVAARHPRRAQGDAIELAVGGETVRVLPRWPDRANLLAVAPDAEKANSRLAEPFGADIALPFAFDALGRPYLAELDLAGLHGSAGLSGGWGKPRQRHGRVVRPVGGRRARLSIPVFCEEDIEITFVAEPVGGEHAQIMTLWANGARIGVLPVEEWLSRSEVSARIPRSALELGMNDIILDFDHVGEDEDGRSVAAWFESIAIRPLGGAEGEPSPPALLFSGDASGDGRDDVCGWADGRLFAFNPWTGWGWASHDRVPDVAAAAAGDLDGNGDANIAVLVRGGEAIRLFTPSAGTFREIRLKGAPVFPESPRFGADSETWRAMAVGDVNLDGENELVALSGQGIVVLALRGDEWVGVQRLPAPMNGRWLFWDNFSGDGGRKLAVVTAPHGGIVLARFWEAGHGGLSPVEPYHPVWFNAENAFAADMNGDGLAEIALVGRRTETDWRVAAWSPASGKRDILGWAKDTAAWVCGHFRRGLPPPVGSRDDGGQAATPSDAGESAEGEAPEKGVSSFDLDLIPGSKTAAVRTEEGYDLEAVIPWESLGIDPEAVDELAFSLAYIDDDGDGDPSRLVYGGGRPAKLALLGEALRGAARAAFLEALTACSAPAGPLVSGDEPVVEVLKGFACRQGPHVASVTMISPDGSRAVGQREECVESLGSDMERWRVSPDGLADGTARIVVSYGTDHDVTFEAETEIRVEAYEEALREGKRTVSLLRGMVGQFPQAAPTLLARAMSQLAVVEEMADSSRRKGLDDAADDFRALRRLAESMRAGEGGEKLRKALEEPIRAYWSEIDGSPQPYELQVPAGYRGEKDWPLVVQLHGSGYSASRRVSAPSWPEAFVVAPYGRGWTDYMYMGEADVLRVIGLVKAQYRIDPDRVYIAGSSMGGTGCWQLATHYPHLFAAIAPVCANSDAEVWAETWGPFFPPDDPMRELRERMLARISPATYAGNLVNVHVLAAHGGRDHVVYPEATRRVVDRLLQAGGLPIYREEPRAGHGVPARAREGMREWLVSQRRTRRPRRVVLRTADPDHKRAYWVTVNKRSSPLAIAEVEAHVAGTNDIRIRQSNVESLSLDLTEWLDQDAPAPVSAPSLGRWGAEGTGLLVEDLATTIRGDGASENPSAWFRISPPSEQDGQWASVSLWLKRGAADPGPVTVAIRPYAPDGGYSGESPKGAKPLAQTQVSPGDEWQMVTLRAHLPKEFKKPLACVFEMRGPANRGEIRIAGAAAWFGENPLDAWRRVPSDVAGWLTSGERKPGGYFPWLPLDLARTGANISRKPPGVGASSAIPKSGLSLGTFRLRGDVGDKHVAGVWARAEGETALRLAVLNGRTGETVAAESANPGSEWELVSVGFERPAYAREVELKLEREGDDAEAVGLFLVQAPVVPDVFRFPPDPTLIDRTLPLTVRVNEHVAFEGAIPEDGTIHIGDEPERPEGLAKTDRLRGPIGHVFEGPFMLVYGTQGSERDWRMAQREAQVFADDWRLRHQVDCRMKADAEVTEEDVARYHLVLYGGPRVNSVAARLSDGLPVRVEGGAIAAGDARYHGDDLSMKVVYPNPLNPSRYVVMLASTTWQGMFQMTKRFGTWFGWRIYEHWNWYDFVVFDNVSRGPASFLAFGFFDEGWRMAPELTFPGDEGWRKRIPPRSVPSLLKPDESRQATWLSEIMPEPGGMRMGVPGLDRSYRGNPLRPGGQRCERGIGVRAGANLTWRLDGSADRFHALVGIDNEGETLTEERKRWTRVRFEVWGDGRLLAASSVHRWNDPPEPIDADVSGVDILALKTVARGGMSWIYGSASWGDARVESERRKK